MRFLSFVFASAIRLLIFSIFSILCRCRFFFFFLLLFFIWEPQKTQSTTNKLVRISICVPFFFFVWHAAAHQNSSKHFRSIILFMNPNDCRLFSTKLLPFWFVFFLAAQEIDERFVLYRFVCKENDGRLNENEICHSANH